MFKRTTKLELPGRASRSRLALLLGVVTAFLLVSVTQAFAAETPHVKVKIGGTGSGEVKSVSIGIYQGTPPIECSYNGTVTSGVCENTPKEPEEEEGFFAEHLEPLAAAGSEFVGWTIEKGEMVPSGVYCPVGSVPAQLSKHQCWLFNEEENKNIEWEVTARFALGPALSVNKSGAGTGAVECEFDGGGLEACGAPHAKGTKVKVVATAGVGSELGSVSGSGSAAACAGSPCEFTIEADSAINVSFTAPGLVVYLGGTGEGSVTSTSPDSAIDCGTECSAGYSSGTVVTLEAHPQTGAVFGGWIGCRHTGATTCEVKIAGETEVTAVFVKNGVEGPHGATGPQGAAGAQGTTGAQGTQGVKGVQGAGGAPGAQGPQGAAGQNGAQGGQGPAGQNGAQGPQGAAGPEGKQGAAGKVTVTCKVKSAKKVLCTVTQTKTGKNARTARFRWSVRHGGQTVGHGDTGVAGLQRVLNRLRPGHYRLHVDGRWQSVAIGTARGHGVLGSTN